MPLVLIWALFAQLRDEDLRPLPGVEVGDIGTKAGDNFVDIGYLRLQVNACMTEIRLHI